MFYALSLTFVVNFFLAICLSFASHFVHRCFSSFYSVFLLKEGEAFVFSFVASVNPFSETPYCPKL